MNKNRYKIILLLLSIVTITLSIGLTTSLKNMQKYNDKYDTVSLLENKEVLNLEQMEELTRKTLIVCSTGFDVSNSGAISVEQSGNIYTLTYASTKEAEKAYNKYYNDSNIIFCKLDDVLKTQCNDCDDTEHTDLSEIDYNYEDDNTTFLVTDDVMIQYGSIQEIAASAHLEETGNYNIYNNILNNFEGDTNNHKKPVIVVIDSGATGQYEKGYNAINGSNDVTDTNGHGTKMIEIIEKSMNGMDFEIIPIKIANENGLGNISSLISAFEYASTLNPTVINMSFISNEITNSDLIHEYIAKFMYNNVAVIASAGNLNSDASGYVPSKFEEAIVVGSCDNKGNRKDFSNYGQTVDFNIVSNSTSEAAALTTAMFATAYAKDIQVDFILNKSAIVYQTNNNEVIKYRELQTDEQLAFWWCYSTTDRPSNYTYTETLTNNLGLRYRGTITFTKATTIANGVNYTHNITVPAGTVWYIGYNCGDGTSYNDSNNYHEKPFVYINGWYIACGPRLNTCTQGHSAVCGGGNGWYSYTEIDKVVHTHSYTVDSGVQYKAATCTTPRYNYLKCSCGYNPQSSSYIVAVGSALGHSWSYKYKDNNGISQGERYQQCGRSGCGITTDYRYWQRTRIRYQNADGTWGSYSTQFGDYYPTGTRIPGWSRAADSAYKAASTGWTEYTVQSTAYENYVNVYRQTYNQTVKVRYQNADGTWGAYSNVINNSYYYGATVSWSRAADATYKAASISYTATSTNTKYVDVYRQTYSQVVKVRYENADGTFTAYSNVINASYRYGQTVSWSRAADTVYKVASTSYTVTAAKTTEITVYRQTYTFDINGFLEGTSFGSLAGTFNNISLQFGSFDVTVNGVSSANDVGDYYTSIRYGSTIVVSDIKAISGYKYNGVYSCSGSSTSSSPLSFTITQNSSLTLTFDDETKPVITFTSSHSDWTNANVTLTFKATDASTVTKMELLRDGVVVKTVNSGDQSTYTISTDENIEYTVRATDLFGNVQTKSLTVKRDTVKPTVKLDKHAGNWASSHTVNINVSDDASGIIDSGYYFSLESTLNQSYTSEGTKLTYSATQNKDGVWTLYYMAKDKAGNIVKGSTSAYCVDNTLPTIDNYNIEYKGDHVVVNVQASDNLSKINGWNYNKTGTTPTTWVTTGLTANGDNVNWSFEIDEAGTYYIFVKDTKGNVGKPIKIVLTTYTIDYINNYGGNTSVYKTLDKIFVGSEWMTESAPVNTTYTFKGWNTNNLGTGVNINADTKYQFTEQFITNTLKQSIKSGTNNKLSLYGWWEKGYSLTFNLNGGLFNKSNTDIVLTGKFYNNVTSYTFDIVGELTAEKINYYDKQVGAFNSYGTLGVNGTNKDIIRKSIDGTTYRLLGWSTNKNAKVPDSNLIVYDNNHNTTYTISSNTTLYAVWEPVLYVQVAGYRNLGTLEDSDTTNILKVATQGSTVVSGQTYNGFITTIARPGEAIKYNLQFRGELDRIQVTVDPYISNMYDLQNTVYDDILNKIDISSMEEVIPSEGYDKAYSSLNRLIKNPDKSITRQFYLPQYLGSELAYEASKQQTQYYVDYKFINTNSFYYDYMFGTDEIITVRQYIILAKSSSVNGEVDSVLNDLRTKLKIRLR